MVGVNPQKSLLSGRIFGDYQILDVVGRGAMATVYRAHDRRTSHEVAIKFISPALAEIEQFILRFRREVKLVARLNHPNIVPVLDYGEQDGYAYQVMPFLKAGSLTDRLEKGPLSLEAGVRLFDQVATALAYAHQQGVVHRDVKPSNILFDPEGNALLADFGTARLVETTESLTGSAVVGTPAYIAPEQVQGGPVDGRSDQYALGVVLFQLATGSLPFSANTPMGYLLKHVNEPFPAARERSPQVPKTIEHIILKATAKDPKQRFETISEMNRALQAALAHILDPISNEAPTFILPRAKDRTAVAGIHPRTRRAVRIAGAAAAVFFFVLAVPVFADGLVNFLESVSSPAESSLTGSTFELTAQVATIESLSTQLASSMSDSNANIEPAGVQTLAAMEFAAAEIEGIKGSSFNSFSEPTSSSTAAASASQVVSQTPAYTEAPASTAVPPSTTPELIPTPPSPEQTPTASSTSVASVTPMETPTPTDTHTPVPTSTPTHTHAPQPTPTDTHTPVPTSTPTHTPTPPRTPTPSNTPTSMAKPSCSNIFRIAQRLKGDDFEVRVQNNNVAPAYLRSAYLDWTIVQGGMEVDKFLFDDTYWSGNDSTSPTGPISSWEKLKGGGDREWWEVDFKGAPSPLWGTYSVDLIFEFEGMGMTCPISGYVDQVQVPTNTPGRTNTPDP